MNRFMAHRAHLFLISCCAVVFSLDSVAQTPYSQRFKRSSVSFEVFVPKFKYSTYSGDAFFLRGKIKASPENFVVIEVPFAVGSHEVTYYSYPSGLVTPITQTISDNIIGNIYIGTEIGKDGSTVFGEIGVRFPLASEKSFGSGYVGIASDIDRWEAFISRGFTVGGALNIFERDPLGPFFRIRLGPSLWLSTRGGGGLVALSSSIGAGYDGSDVMLAIGISFREFLSLSAGGNSNVSQFEASAGVHLENLHPQVQLRLPLEKILSYNLDYVIGVSVGVEIK